MARATAAEWTASCRAEGLDPAEIRRVLDRYRAYHTYYVKSRRGEPLPIESWFNWYRMESASETAQRAPAPSGCSVDDGARNRGLIHKPEAFLRALMQLAASDAGGE